MITYGKSSRITQRTPGPVYKNEKEGRQIKANWILIFWFVMFVSILGQQGGIVEESVKHLPLPFLFLKRVKEMKFFPESG